MMDRITLRGLTAEGYHGVFDFEKRDGQPFSVDITVEADLSAAGATDDLHHTINYATIAEVVVARITGPSVDLIERLAQLIADDVLQDERIDAVTVTVHKPKAPIPHAFADAAVTMHRLQPAPAVIACGANLGDREATLTAAVQALAHLPGVEVRKTSALVESAPVGGPDQPAYLNGVILVATTLTPAALLAALHQIEADFGRVRVELNGPRTLDLDLISYGRPGERSERRSGDPALLLPHPRAHERAFVLVPWRSADPAAALRLPTGEIRSVAAQSETLPLDGIWPGPDWRPSW